MANTYTLINSNVLTSDAASVTFSSIPGTYTDLKFVYSARVTAGGIAHTDFIKFNNSSANFKVRTLQAEGSGTPASGSDTTGTAGLNNGPTSTSNTFANTEIYIPNYASSNYKSYSVDSVTENNATTAYIQLVAGLWSNTAAITEINIDPDSGNYLTGSSFYLYGIKNS
jgi:hypothetical protein